MRRTQALVIFITAATFPIPSFGGLFGPSNYEDCILEKMKGVTSDVAAREVKEACQIKFSQAATNSPVKSHSYRMTLWESSDGNLSSDGRGVLDKLRIEGTAKNENRRVLRFHNGSRVRISSVRLGLISASKQGDKSPSRCSTVKIDYKGFVDVSPQGGVLPDSDGEIHIYGAHSTALDRVSNWGIEENLIKQNAICIVGFETGHYSDESELRARLKGR